MRKLLKIALVALGVRALLRWRKRRHAVEATQAAKSQAAADPADELRQKLAASRQDEEATSTASSPEASVGERRADVHEQGRAALDEMTSSDEA